MATRNTKSERQRRHERTSVSAGGFSMNLKVDTLVGILLAILGTFIIFFGGGTSLIPLITRIIGIIAICLGVVAVVNYFRYRNSGTSLIVGIVEIVLGLALIIAASQIAQWIFLALGVILILYGIYTLVMSRGNMLKVIMGVVYIVLGILIILFTFCNEWQWLQDWGKYIIGAAAYCGALFFLIFN